VDYDPCAKTNTIRFNEYMIYDQTPAYELSVSVDGGFWEYPGTINTTDLEVVATVPTGGAGVLVDHKTNIYSYTFENIEPDKSYRYRVSAKLGGFDDFSLSTTSEVFSPSYPLPQKPSIQSVSVQQDGSILINADVLDTQLCQSVYYNRFINPGETPVIIQENLPAAGTFLSTSDNEVESTANSYFYEIAVTDQCGFPLAATEVHRSILLEGEIDTQNTITLNWNSYEGWIVTGQELYRSFNGVETLLATPTAFTETYQDNTIGPLAAAGGVLNYYVKAINNDGSGRYSNSNIVSFTFDVEPLLPNAFNPYSTEVMNSSFKPVQTYLNASGYQLQVYHRWGGLIWETNNPSEGWDGRNKNGKLLPRGTYAYLLLYQNAAGIGQQKRGTITLLY
jgi:gliding motility-associated-like protein